MNHILEHLSIGNPADAQNATDHFDAFLNTASEVEMDPSLFGDKPYLRVSIDDMKPIPAFRLMEAAEFIDQHINNKRILVFCDGGVGRYQAIDHRCGGQIDGVAARGCGHAPAIQDEQDDGVSG